jgi:hypothetical protein
VIHKIHKVSFCVVLLHRLKEHSANVHRGAYALAERATEASQNLRILQDTHIFHHKKKKNANQQTWQPHGFQWTNEIKMIELIELIGLYANMQLDAH